MSVTCNIAPCATNLDLETILISLFAKDANGCVGLKIRLLDATDCQDLTDLKDCASYLTTEQAIKMAIVDDGCGGFALGVFQLSDPLPR